MRCEPIPDGRSRGALRAAAGGVRSDALATAANVALCAVAAAIPMDEVLVTMTGVDRAAFAPTLHTGVLATALWFPLLLRRPWLRRPLAPPLLLAGSMMAGVLVLFVAAAAGDVRVEPDQLPYHPFKFAVLALLFTTAARDPRWRRRFRLSYMGGWALLVAYAGWGIARGTAAFTHHAGDVVRVSVAGLNENQQSILVATGMIIAFAELLRSPRPLRSVPWIAAFLGGCSVFVVGVSRGASVGLAAGLLFVLAGFVRGGHLRRGALAALALASVSAVGVVSVSGTVGDAAGALVRRFEATVREREVGDRTRLSRDALRLAIQNPWSGVGFGRAAQRIGSDPHNGYLKIVAEGGAPAALLLGASLLAIAAVLRRASRIEEDLGAAGALVLLLVVAVVGQALMRPPFWYFLASTAAAAAGPRDEERTIP